MTGKDRCTFDPISKSSFNSTDGLIGFLGANDVIPPSGVQAVVDGYRRSGRRWVVDGIRWITERGRSLGELAASPVWMTPRMLASLG
jgi:hypothetical protein